LLQNRNAFGHALITDIAGNAGDKPLQPTFPQIKEAGCARCCFSRRNRRLVVKPRGHTR
jgi:hypothetical protein